ncbi:Aste57867_24901 [Aphanomyces stellatus]|uniref:Vacuolar membrane protease n=1 Tax=Aphanomyces stellatus TaxID=120398 RepID=A0A485LRR8_9STRA|nr:hypothetical protein As57867_024823 [Aphanomyces stellatus]VFU01535.1 Aste57867_24901 [Aphanomyces stellatus]
MTPRIVLWISFFLAAGGLSWITIIWRSRMPDVLPPSDSPDVFSGEAAYETLGNITKVTHPVESQANLDVYHYLYDRMEALRASVGGSDHYTLHIETPRSTRINASTFQTNLTREQILALPTGDTRYAARCKEHEGYLNDTQIVVRIPGVLPSSILLTAHFDSVATSTGATDDGAGVAVIIETLRAILASPTRPKHTLIAFLNNGEETGLCGSAWFVRSRLHETLQVKALVNVEGGGAGGRAILFRATDNELVSLYSRVAPYPHMNSFGGSVISLLGSATDYSNYVPQGIPAVDIAFYEHRDMYHSSNDNLAHIAPADVQHCGANVLAFTRALLGIDSLDEWVATDHALYFDLFGQWGFTLSVWTRWGVLMLLWATTAAVVGVHFYFFPVKAASLTVFWWSLVGEWGTYASSLGLGAIAALLLNAPLLAFVSLTHKSSVAWTLLPTAILGHVVGAAISANRWRGRHGTLAMPSTIDWMHLATAGSTFAACLSLVFLINAPALYLLPVAALAYNAVLVTFFLVTLVTQCCRGQKPASLWQSHVSYASIPVVSTGMDDDDVNRAAPSVVLALVAAAVGFLATAFPFAVDFLWSVRAVGGADAMLLSAAPLIVTPVLFLLVPFFVSWNPQDGLFVVVAQLYLGVGIAACVQYALTG